MILLFGGTSDSIKIMETLLEGGCEVTLSVATNYGKIYSKKFKDRVIQSRMDQDEMETYLKDHAIDLVVDATHPFADLVSKNAIAAAQAVGIPYLRFERPLSKADPRIQQVTSLAQACQKAESLWQEKGHGVEDHIYLATGSKTVGDFSQVLGPERLVVRVLPVASVVKHCEAAGLSAGQIHAIKPPYSKALNTELYKKVNAQIMITKESGQAGGMDEKVSAALDRGMDVIEITRPYVAYPKMTHAIDEVLSLSRQLLKEGQSSADDGHSKENRDD